MATPPAAMVRPGGRPTSSTTAGGLTNAATNTAVELPGSYTIDLKGTKQSLAVRAGQQTILQAK